jgi:3-methylfumaryl-CoA hydratase
MTERTEFLVPGPAEALAGLLDVPLPDVERDGLPLLWHWLYLLERPAQADLGPDGHPGGAGHAGRHRMWAGGRVRTPGVLRCGEPATRRTEVSSVHEKQGRSGALTFVVVGHQITQRGEVVVDEEQDIVYRAGNPIAPAADGPVVPVGADEWAIDVSPTLLFRFSALTYNAHRIHYDRDYARDVEGYPGLLTHGPLQALAMAEAARALGRTGDFEYRLVAPLFDHQGMVVRAASDTGSTSVRDVHGRQTATGTVTP